MRKFSILLFIILAITLVVVMGNTYRAVPAQTQGQSGRLPFRDATVASLRGAGRTGQLPGAPTDGWNGKLGVDAKWENCSVVAEAHGNIVERWTQWDKILQRPHFVAINPYDPEKHVWVLDDHMHAIYKFTHDGKELVQTIGMSKMNGADGSHFNRTTFLELLPVRILFVSDW